MCWAGINTQHTGFSHFCCAWEQLSIKPTQKKPPSYRLNHWQVLVFKTKISRLRLVSDTTLVPLWLQQSKKVTWPVWVTICVFKERALGGRRCFRCFYLEHGLKKNTGCQALQMCFQSMASRPAAYTAPGSLSEMQMSRLHLRLTESGTLGWNPGFRGLTSLPGDADACSILKATALGGKKIGFFLPLPSYFDRLRHFPPQGEQNEGA